MPDLTTLDLSDAQREAVEALLADSDARCDEAFQLLRDAHARLAAHRHRARDAEVAARLVDPSAELDPQFVALRKSSPYLFEPLAAPAGGARIERRPPDPMPDMNSVLRRR